MASFNKVILMGNLTRDPEMRFTPNGSGVCHFGVAVNRRYKSQEGDWREETTFVDVTMWGKRGEAFAKFHQKGKTCFLEGELRLDQWEDKNGGGKRSKLYVVAQNWEFVDGRGEGGGGGGGGGSWGGRQEQGGGYSQGSGSGSGAAAAPAWGGPPPDVDVPQGEIGDTPF